LYSLKRRLSLAVALGLVNKSRRWSERIERYGPQALGGADTQRSVRLCHSLQVRFPAEGRYLCSKRRARQRLLRSISPLASPHGGAYTEGLGEYAGEMALIGEAARGGDLDNRHFRPLQQFFGARDSLPQQPLVWWQSCRMLKGTYEVTARKPAKGGELGEIRIGGEVVK
jgi:hypothetical protein